MATPLDGNARRDLLRAEYKTAYRRFKADAWPLLDSRERSEWGIVFTMQHYGLPTRLLDWSESVACAVFFAQWRRNPDREAAIWVLDPQALNHAAVGREGLIALDDDHTPGLFDSQPYHPKFVAPPCDLRSVAVSPLFTNPRMTAQRAAFTISGDSSLVLDSEFSGVVQAGRLVKLSLAPSTFADANQFLATAGLTAFSFFPDLQGLGMRHEAELARRIQQTRRAYPGAYSSS